MTHRQFMTWLAWQRAELNRPGPVEYYLMTVAAEVRRGYLKDPRRVQLEDFRLEFSEGERKPAGAPVSLEQETAWAKATWFVATGCPGAEGKR